MCAHFEMALATVLEQVVHETAHAVEVRGVEDRAPVADARNQPSPYEDREMGRERVLEAAKGFGADTRAISGPNRTSSIKSFGPGEVAFVGDIGMPG